MWYFTCLFGLKLVQTKNILKFFKENSHKTHLFFCYNWVFFLWTNRLKKEMFIYFNCFSGGCECGVPAYLIIFKSRDVTTDARQPNFT